MYLMFENPDVSIEIITRIGQIIYYDFHQDFPSLFQKFQVVEQLPYDLKHEGEEYWKNKYFALLEEYNALLKKFTTEIWEIIYKRESNLFFFLNKYEAILKPGKKAEATEKYLFFIVKTIFVLITV